MAKKYSPETWVIEQLCEDPFYAKLIQELILDFDREMKNTPVLTSQSHTNVAFIAFCMGCNNSLNEQSAFLNAITNECKDDSYGRTH